METIDTNTLSTTIKELNASNVDILAEWLDGLIKVYKVNGSIPQLADGITKMAIEVNKKCNQLN